MERETKAPLPLLQLVREILVLLNYAGFTKIEIVIVTLHPFGCCSTIKFTLSASFQTQNLSVALLHFHSYIVQFSRCRLPTAFAVRFEDPTSRLGLQIQQQICLVGPSGLEPPTLRLSVVRSSQLSYGPVPPRGVYPLN